MVELGNQHVLVLLQLFALSDVSRQSLDAQEPPCGVELALCRLLQPHLPAVRTAEAEIQGIRRVVGAELANVRLEGRAIVGMDPPEEIVVPRPGHALLESKDMSGIVAALRLARDGIPFEGHHLAGCQCIRQVGFALLEHGLRLLALRDIDVGADDALRDTITVVRYQAARLDPSDLAPGTDNTILAKVLAPPVCDSLLEVNVQPMQIVWVDSSSPIGAPCLYGSLGQAVNGCIALRNLHSPRADVEGEASDQSDFPGEGKLRVALGECLLCLLALRDVAGDAEQSHGRALGAAHNRALERDPVHLAGMYVARRMHHTVFRATDASGALAPPQTQYLCALCHRDERSAALP